MPTSTGLEAFKLDTSHVPYIRTIIFMITVSMLTISWKIDLKIQAITDLLCINCQTGNSLASDSHTIMHTNTSADNI